MYRGRPWTIRMFSGFGDASETNKRWKDLLLHGETGLSTAFDFPTLEGYDSDAPLAVGEVGRAGVAISCLPDVETLFGDIQIDKNNYIIHNQHSCYLLVSYVFCNSGKTWDSYFKNWRHDTK